MAPTYSGGYGLSYGNNAQMRDFGDMRTVNYSYAGPVNSTSSGLLTAPGANSYYKIWGIQASNSKEDESLFNVAASGAEDDIVLGFVSSLHSPIGMFLPFPVQLPANAGLEVNWISMVSAVKVQVNIFYTQHEL